MAQYCYIYSKDNKIVVKNHCLTSSVVHKELIEDGYKHVSTVDPAVYIQHLLNLPDKELITEKNNIHEIKT